jgi:hypothetical protein
VYRRVREIEEVIKDTYRGKQLPNDDAGRDDLFIVAQHIRGLGGNVVRHVVAFAAMWATWMSEAEARALAEEVIARPREWDADEIAADMGVTKEQRDRLLGGLTTPHRREKKSPAPNRHMQSALSATAAMTFGPSLAPPISPIRWGLGGR